MLSKPNLTEANQQNPTAPPQAYRRCHNILERPSPNRHH